MDYLRIFRRYWWVIVVLTAIGAAATYITTLFLTPQYQSTARLFVATQNGTSVTEAYQNNLFSQQRVISYASLATSEQLAARAVDQLKAPISPGELRGKITASAEDKTVLLDVSATDENPSLAQTYANAIADQLVGLVSELETSRRGGTPSAGVVVVDEANYPTDSIGLGWTGLGFWYLMGIGTGIGLVLGIIVAIAWGILDKRLRGRDSVEAATDSTLMGALPADDARAEQAVVDLVGDGLYAERLRELRTNLRFAVPKGGDAPARVVAVVSPRSAEGRTTVALDLAAALAESGRSVILVEGDLRKPALAARLSLEDDDRGLGTVLVGEHTLSDAVINGIAIDGHQIALLPAGPKAARAGELWANDRATALFAELKSTFDYVIVDTPALDTYADGANVGALCDGALLVARVGSTTAAALRRAIHSLDAANVTVIGPVATFDHVGLLGKRSHREQVRKDAEASEGHVGADGADDQGDGASTEAIAVSEDQLVGPEASSRRSRHGSS